MTHITFPFAKLLEQKGFSERKFARLAGISRGSMRKLTSDADNFNLPLLSRAAAFFGFKVQVMIVPEGALQSDCSTVGSSLLTVQDGFNSWKIHFMNLVDEFRRTLDIRLLLLPPPKGLDAKLKALLAAIVLYLAEEASIDAPGWAKKNYFLDKPWFVSGVQSLKASAILESPYMFRNNNIFVQQNFLERA